MSGKEIEYVLESQADPNGTYEAVRSVIEAPNGRKVDFSVVFGDITQTDADVIVCPANDSFLYFPGGVQRAIASTAGIEVFNEARQQAIDYIADTGGVPHRNTGRLTTPLGYAVATSAGNLIRPKAIIHVNSSNHDPSKLYTFDDEAIQVSTESVLRAADEIGNVRSIALPALGTGLVGMSLEESMRATVLGIRNYFNQKPDSQIQKTAYIIYGQATRDNALNAQELVFQCISPAPRASRGYH